MIVGVIHFCQKWNPARSMEDDCVSTKLYICVNVHFLRLDDGIFKAPNRRLVYVQL
jgi:hypothetical protein